MTTKKSKAMVFLDELIGEPLSLGGLLTAIRQCDEIPQSTLAKRLGISKSHLCDIEKGRKVVSLERAARFAVELGYSEEQFVRLALQQLVEVAGLPFWVELQDKPIARAPKPRPRARRPTPKARRAA
jgi:transcriptional regulator with XRE-family HTH domain